MNKLVLATAVASALFGASYGATGAIESQNIVGYAQNALKFGGTVATTQFIDIASADAYPLSSITPSGTDISDNVNLQTLDAYGRSLESYLWIDYAGDDGDLSAWVDPDTYEIISGVSFPAGAGIWVTGTAENQSIVTSGQVGRKDVSVALKFGGTVTGNPFPSAIGIQDILITGSDTSDNVNLQTLDAYGRTDTSYLWIDYAGDDGDQQAWVDPDTYEIITGITIGGGAGLWITGTAESQAAVFPAPSL